MFRKTLAIVMVAVVAGLMGVLGLSPAAAQQEGDPSATRSISPRMVDPGGEVMVSITADDYGRFGSVTEMLPAGFTYVSVSGDLNEDEVDNHTEGEVGFTLLGRGPISFTYTVTASSVEGSHTFSGVLKDEDRQGQDVVGDPEVTVAAAPEPDPSAARSISPRMVEPGGEVMVSITADDYGRFGRVTEILPAGFTYVSVSGDLDEDVVNNDTEGEVRFTLQGRGPISFTYTVTASSVERSHTFSGVLRDDDRQDHDVVGDPEVTVAAAPEPDPSATRSISPRMVEPGGEVMVSITADDYGRFGRVTEMLPAGFTYVSVSGDLEEDDVNNDTEGEVRFTLQGRGPISFTYTVTASSMERSHTFSGVLRDDDRQDHDVVGDPEVTVAAAPEPDPSATRSISPRMVEPGGEVMVSITADDYGRFGRVTEMLPAGFTYVSVSGDLEEDDVNNDTEGEVRFTLQGRGPISFTYTVTASSMERSHTFSGVLRDDDRQDHDVGCPCSVTVRVAAPEPEPQRNRAPAFPGSSTTRSIDENSAVGANVGARVTASDPDRDTLTYTLTGTDASSFTINSSGQIMVGTGTMLDFEDKPSYTVTVTATDPDNASDTITVTITVDNVEDPGVVTITPDTTPQVGTELTASLEDQDGSVVNLTWQWQKDDGQGSYADIPGATMMSYTPVMADDGSRLQATAMYDDGEGSGKTALGMTANAVGATDDIFSWYDYDTDGTPGISEIEASVAVLDYLIRSLITRDEAIQVVTAYREDPLIVGHLNTVTGSLSYFGPEQNNGVELAALHVNQAGGVHGAQMIIVTRDTATNPAQGVAAARALLDVEGAVAIVGALASSVTLAVAQSVTVPKQRLLISPASTSPAITVLEDDDFLFRTTVSDAAQGVVLARLAWEIGYETAGIMLINNAYGEGLADQFEETFVSLGGRVTGKVPHEDSQPTYTSELEKATEGDPNVLLAISYPGQAEVYLRESLEGGYSDTFLFVDATKSPDMMEVVGWDPLEGMLGTAQGSPDSPSLLEFQGSYAAVHEAPPEHPFIAENYDAAVLIALAAAKAGTTTDSVAIRDALRSIANPPGEAVGPGVEGIKKALMLIAEGKDINYEGAAGTVDFDENGDVTGYIEIWKVEGGEIKSTGRFELP